jgi:hypothetical protein
MHTTHKLPSTSLFYHCRQKVKKNVKQGKLIHQSALPLVYASSLALSGDHADRNSHQMAAIYSQLPTPVDFPSEILLRVFDFADHKTLATARLVCRKFCDTATHRFAVLNFTERTHVVSPYSTDKLLNVTEHPVFGKHVKTIAICSARCGTIFSLSRPSNNIDPNLCLNGYTKTRRFARRMERVFSNIRTHSGSVAISIYDHPDGAVLSEILYSGKSHSMLMRCCGWTRLRISIWHSLLYSTAETLEETIYAARRAKCPVTSLKIYLCGANSEIKHRPKLEVAMRRVLESSLIPLNVNMGDAHGYQISYDHNSQYLKFRRVSFVRANGGINTRIPLRALYALLLTQKVARLRIAWIKCLEFTSFQPFFSIHLRRLELHDISLSTDNFDQNLWSQLIETISGFSDLHYCELGDFDYFMDHDQDSDGTIYLQLPGHGRYRTRFMRFRLRFPDGTARIKIDGDDVSGKLQSLASYVRAAEDSKRQKIISEGFVSDGIVGVIRDIEEQFRNIRSRWSLD